MKNFIISVVNFATDSTVELRFLVEVFNRGR